MLSKHFQLHSKCFPFKFNTRGALRQANYESTSGCKFTWKNNVYISVSEDLKDVQHVAKLPRTTETFVWSSVQQKGYHPSASKLLCVTQND